MHLIGVLTMLTFPSDSDILTVRYAADDKGWMVNGISANAPPVVACGAPGTEPDWLVRILAAARVGGYCMDIPKPPPAVILWFAITPDYQLHSFDKESYGDDN